MSEHRTPLGAHVNTLSGPSQDQTAAPGDGPAAQRSSAGSGEQRRPVSGAHEALARLRAGGLALRFVTNTTSRSRAQTLVKLERLGFNVDSDELVTPAVLAVSHCLEHDRRRVLLVMNEKVKEDSRATGRPAVFAPRHTSSPG